MNFYERNGLYVTERNNVSMMFIRQFLMVCPILFNSLMLDYLPIVVEQISNGKTYEYVDNASVENTKTKYGHQRAAAILESENIDE